LDVHGQSFHCTAPLNVAANSAPRRGATDGGVTAITPGATLAFHAGMATGEPYLIASVCKRKRRDETKGDWFTVH
jgi:hypothetical protein